LWQWLAKNFKHSKLYSIEKKKIDHKLYSRLDGRVANTCFRVLEPGVEIPAQSNAAQVANRTVCHYFLINASSYVALVLNPGWPCYTLRPDTAEFNERFAFYFKQAEM